MQGVKPQDVIKHWYNFKPWKNRTFEEVLEDIINEMNILIENVNIMSGAIDVINFYHFYDIPMAIASSSFMSLIRTVVDKMQIASKIKILHSSEYEKRGKPFPDVFLTTAQKLNTEPVDCLVFEDSINGIKAAKAAGMRVVAVPYPENYERKEYDIADFKSNF